MTTARPPDDLSAGSDVRCDATPGDAQADEITPGGCRSSIAKSQIVLRCSSRIAKRLW